MDTFASEVVVVLVAVVIDVMFGDPPNRWHPVAWMGAALRSGANVFARGSRARLLASGAAVTLGVGVVSGLVGWGITAAAGALGVGGLLLQAIALKSVLSLRDLRRAGLAVADDLARNDLVSARSGVALHLVSRDTRGLAVGHVASAAIESLAENLTDSFVAPLCFYLAFGLPGAALYRAVNTADAMLGYRDGVLEHFGKTAARLDDVLNLIPARLAAFALALGAALVRLDGLRAIRIMWRDHVRTASPNAGWTIAAMAGALGVRLEKLGAYTVGDGPLPGPLDIPRAARAIVAGAAVAGLLLLAIGISVR